MKARREHRTSLTGDLLLLLLVVPLTSGVLLACPRFGLTSSESDSVDSGLEARVPRVLLAGVSSSDSSSSS